MKGKYIALILFTAFYLWMGFGCEWGSKNHEFYVPMFCLLTGIVGMWSLIALIVWLKLNWNKKINL